MQLNKFTDYGFRILMLLGSNQAENYTIGMLATQLQVSENHLVKIVHFMAKQGWLITTRGKGGGIRLAPETLHLPLGDLIRILQGDPQMVNCTSPLCVLHPRCGLKSLLNEAQEQFYQSLNQYRLEQVLPTKKSDAAQQIPITQLG
ncbi:transcriptional regulator [Pasteurellaceae bacterium Macca]|nr:transcriptional regulator [Pasteurellaceae bacterium Macca]